MMRYTTLLFDLDGTIIDSREGITKSVQYALDKCEVAEKDPERLLLFIGPPLLDSFMEYYSMDRERAAYAVEMYRERYGVVGIFEAKVYDGIVPLLRRLHEEGRKLAVASSKPEVYVKRILDKFGIGQYFDEIVGAAMDGTRDHKPDILKEVFRRCAITPENKASVIMIGDRRYDIEGAKTMGIDSIGVRYGFAPDGELERAGASYVADTAEGLDRLLKEI